jgi:hypothetical protein
MNKQSGVNAKQIDKDKYPESKKPFDYQINELLQEKITYLSMFSTLFIDLRLVVSIQTNHMCHITKLN